MALWLLKIDSHLEGYDWAYGFVIRAKDETSARQLASTHAGDEGDTVWLSQTLSICNVLDPFGTEEMILRDFRAG